MGVVVRKRTKNCEEVLENGLPADGWPVGRNLRVHGVVVMEGGRGERVPPVEGVDPGQNDLAW